MSKNEEKTMRRLRGIQKAYGHLAPGSNFDRADIITCAYCLLLLALRENNNGAAPDCADGPAFKHAISSAVDEIQAYIKHEESRNV